MAIVNAETGEIVQHLDADEARDLTEAIKASASKLYTLVVQAHEREAHRALGYGSWAEYCRAEFDMGRSRSYQFLDQAKVIGELTAAAGVSTPVDITEAAARDVKGDLPALSQRIAGRTADEVPADAPDEIQTETKRRIIEEEVERTRQQRQAPPAPTIDVDAVERELDELPDVRRRNLRSAVLRASRELHKVMADLEPYDAASLVESDERTSTVNALQEQIRWLTRYRDALKRSGLTVMEGGRQ